MTPYGPLGRVFAVKGEITAEDTSFLKNINDNLFDGNFLGGFYITGASGSPIGVSLVANAETYKDYKIIALNVEPGETYSVNRGAFKESDGYYYMKIITMNKTVEEIIKKGSTSTADVGSYGLNYASQNNDKTNQTFTTAAGDKSAWVMVSRFQETYAEVRKGGHVGLEFDQYGPIYQPDATLDVYSKQEAQTKAAEVSTTILQTRTKLRIVKDSNGFLILYPGVSGNYLGYQYRRFQNTTIRADIWRLTTIQIYGPDLTVLHQICPSGYDVEGVLKITGEADYIGSVHGDETFTDVFVYIDGLPSSVSAANFDIHADNIEFIVKSNITHADTTELAFVKTKIARFDWDGVHIKSQWKAAGAYTLDHVRGCLLSVNKVSGSVELIETYRDSFYDPIPKSIPPVSGTEGQLVPNNDVMTDFIMSSPILAARLWTGVRGGNSNKSTVTDFGDRIKPYIDCYVNEAVAADEIVFCETNFLILTA